MNAQSSSQGPRWRVLVAWAGAMAGAAALATGCLGQDYKSIELSLTEWSSGWQATVEPDEQFSVELQPPRVYPDARWRVASGDSSIVQSVDQFVTEPAPQEPGVAAVQVFVFRAVRQGESELSFEARVASDRVATAEYSVSVVADACEAGVGQTAPRCRTPMPEHKGGWSEWDHGRTVQVGMNRPTELTLTAPALYPRAQWRPVAVDAALLDVGEASVSSVRTPGDFDNQDTTKPDTFVPLWSYAVQGLAPGETELAFESVSDGQRVDIAQFTVRVVEVVEEGEYLVPPGQQ